MILLEVLIAMALIALCILPLITPHIAMIREQQRMDAVMRLDHSVHLLYVDVIEQMHKNIIKWNQVMEGKPIPISDDMWERIGIQNKIPLQGFFRFQEIRHKPGKPAEWNAHHVKVIFFFMPPDSTQVVWEFPYELSFLRHVPGAENSAEDSPKEPEQKPQDKEVKK